jgi:hypothetical protein
LCQSLDALTHWEDSVAGLPAVVVLVLVVAVGLAVSVGGRPGPSQEATVTAARRHALVVSVTAVVVGLFVVGWLLWAAADPGHGFPGSMSDAAAFAPLAFALGHTVVLAVGELTWPRPTGSVRRARLLRRRLADVVPRRLSRLALAATAAAVVLLVLGALLSDPDGRSISRAQGTETRGHGPWPGPHYGGVLATELVLLAAAVAVALWLVVNRPAVATDDERIETALRRASAHRVLRAPTAALLVLTGPLLALTGGGLSGVGYLPLAVGTVSALVGLVLELSGLVVLCWPAPRVPADEPVPAGS